MLKRIRNIKLGWFIVLIGFGMFVAGLSMVSKEQGTQTLLCFDVACIHMQGVSNICLGFGCSVLGVYMIFKK